MTRGKPSDPEPSGAAEPAPPHYLGHRERLRDRFMKIGGSALEDYELLELVLFLAVPRRDTKALAKTLLERFGSFSEVIGAPPSRLAEIDGLGETSIANLKIVLAAAQRIGKDRMQDKPLMGSWTQVIDYCTAQMAFESKEQFRILFLDKKNFLIADEVQQVGTVDHTPVYPREVIRRALELSASALILVHNHPSGDPQPSPQDVQMTRQIADIASPLGIALHDHIIIGRKGHASLKGMKLF